MTRRSLILLAAAGIFAGLYFYDRDNSTEIVLPGKVINLENQSADQGADTWLVTVEIGGKTLVLNPLTTRSQINIGDAICVSRITRQGQPTEHRRAAASTTC